MAEVSLFLASFVTSAVFTNIIHVIATHKGITDKPDTSRKMHARPTPLLGGIAVGSSILLLVLAVLLIGGERLAILDSHVELNHLIGFGIGVIILMIGGAIDDRANLRPFQQFLFPVAASGVIIASGIGVSVITNPFGGVVQLTPLQSDVLTFIWLMGAIYTTKFLDGLDGLCAGITTIGAAIIALLSLFIFVNMPTAVLAIIIAGSFAGFLLWNFHPALIFLGEAGSTLAGFSLGVLALISGAKFATALLILAIPILDASWVIFQRIVLERRSPFRGDRKHIHFRLVDSGLNQRHAVLLLYALAMIFGGGALFLQSSQKITALGIAGVLALLLFTTYWHHSRNVR